MAAGVGGSAAWMRKVLAYAPIAIVALVVPAASWLDGTGDLAWTMFSKSASYRLRVVAELEDGRYERVSSRRIGLAAGIDARRYLDRADHFTYAPVAPTLRSRLTEIARLGCALSPAARHVEALLEERPTLDSPIETHVASVPCGVVP
jgi:hypothetical protein